MKCPDCGGLMGSSEGDQDLPEVEVPIPSLRRGFSVLPDERQIDPTPKSVRAHLNEDWALKPLTPRKLDFADQLKATTDDSMKVDREVEAERHRALIAAREPVWLGRSSDLEMEEAAVPQSPLFRVLTVGLAGILAFLVLSWGYKILNAKNPERLRALADRMNGLVGRDVVMFPVLEQDTYLEAMAVLKGYFKATTVEELLPYVRDRERTEPLIREYYKTRPLTPVEIVQLPPRSDLIAFETFMGGLADTKGGNTTSFLIEHTDKGYKCDWESMIGYCEVPWEKLAEVRPTKPTLMRVKATQENYYNYDYTDTTIWRCFKLDSDDGEHYLYGYAKRDRGSLMENRTRLEPHPACMVRIRYSEAAAASGKHLEQVEITEYVGDGWLLKKTSDQGLVPAAIPTPDRLLGN